MKCKSTMVVFLILLFSINLVHAADSDKIRNHPGYVNFDNIDIPEDCEETVEVYLQGPILKVVAAVTESEDPALSNMLEDLLLIRVNSFSLDTKNLAKITSRIKKIEKELKQQNWQKIVRVKDKKDRAQIYLKTDSNDRFAGLVVMAIEDSKEVVLVNIVGTIDLNQISKLGKKLDIKELEKINPSQK